MRSSAGTTAARPVPPPRRRPTSRWSAARPPRRPDPPGPGRADPEEAAMATVVVHQEGPVRVVTIDRPDVRNAVDGPTAAALHAAFADFDRDDSAAAAVLTGAGGTFCAGADLKAVADGRG